MIHKKSLKKVLITSTTMTTTITPRSGESESLPTTITTMRMNTIRISLSDKQFPVGFSYHSHKDQCNKNISGNPVINPLAAMVAPLAALALIAAASAVSVNPMLMSIATISRSRRHSGSGAGARQERGLRQMRTLETFLSSLPASSGGSVHERLTLTYLECGDLVSPANHCLERVACLYTEKKGFSKQERDVVSMYVGRGFILS